MTVKAFVAMPFAKEFDKLYDVIEKACNQEEIQAVRSDEIKETGPIINQIAHSIANADILIAEVASRNSNVYYEIGLAYCLQIPSILLAEESAKPEELPFDIRGNRVLRYKLGDEEKIIDKLARTIAFIKNTFVNKKQTKAGDFFKSLDPTNEKGKSPEEYAREIGNDLGLTNAKPKSIDVSSNDKTYVIIVVEDVYLKKGRGVIDPNGKITQCIILP